MVVTLPFVLLLLDYWPLRRTPLLPVKAATEPDAPRFAPAGWGRLLWEKAPLLALSAASSVVTMHAQVRAMKASEHLSLGFRVGNALVAYATYLRKMVWPVDLAVLYAHPGSRLPMRHAVIAAVVLAVLTLLVVVLARRRPAVLVGWLWYLGTLVPAIGVVQVGFQAMADRYTYVPLIGIFMALAWCIPPLPESRPLARFLTATLAGAAVVMCMSLTWRQTLYWRDDPYLWPHVFEVADNPLARCFHAGNLYREGEVEEAEEQCRAALRLDPAFPLAFYNLERYRLYRGDLEGALAMATQAVSLNPNNGGLRHQLGVTLACLERNEKACREFREACRLEPDTAVHHFGLAAILARLGDRSGAAQEYTEGRRLDPSYLDDARKAIEEYSDANDPRKNCPPFALFVAEQVLAGSETPQAEMYQALAKVLAANHRPIAAYAASQRALALAESNARADLIPALREQICSYQPLASKREARALAIAIAAPTISPLSGAALTLALVGADLAEHRFPEDVAAR